LIFCRRCSSRKPVSSNPSPSGYPAWLVPRRDDYRPLTAARLPLSGA